MTIGFFERISHQIIWKNEKDMIQTDENSLMSSKYVILEILCTLWQFYAKLHNK